LRIVRTIVWPLSETGFSNALGKAAFQGLGFLRQRAQEAHNARQAVERSEVIKVLKAWMEGPSHVEADN